MWRRGIVGLVAVVLLAIGSGVAQAAWVLDGFDVTVKYTVPVPQGFTATKESVTVNVSKEKVPETVAAFQAMMADIQQSFAGASPYQGWAPFAWGIHYGPRWKQVP